MNCDVLELFKNNKPLKICAPMVRYSKLQFRTLVRSYNCDLCYTPMILSDSFCKSENARQNEFTTNSDDKPLVVQFAANTVHDFVGASYLVSPYCNGVDLNCGCPQRWAKQKGIGGIMLNQPEKIFDLIRQCRNRIAKPFTVSVKMRLLDNKKTVEICKQLENCGVSYISVHSRTIDQHSEPINLIALKLIKENLHIPLVANGGVKTMEDFHNLYETVSCDGVMVANGLLTNPALFSGAKQTPKDCIQKWLNICCNTFNRHKPNSHPQNNLTFQCFHHHLVFMLEKILPKNLRKIFNNLKNTSDVFHFLREHLDVVPQMWSTDEQENKCEINLEYCNRLHVYDILKPAIQNEVPTSWWTDNNEGKFYRNKVKDMDSNTEISNIFAHTEDNIR